MFIRRCFVLLRVTAESSRSTQHTIINHPHCGVSTQELSKQLPTEATLLILKTMSPFRFKNIKTTIIVIIECLLPSDESAYITCTPSDQPLILTTLSHTPQVAGQITLSRTSTSTMPHQTRNSLHGRQTADASNVTSKPSEPSFPATSPATDETLSAAIQAENERAERACFVCKQEYGTGEAPENRVTLSCGHDIGLACANRWLMVPRRQNGCPLCQTKFFEVDEAPAANDNQLPPPLLQQIPDLVAHADHGQLVYSIIIFPVPLPQNQWNRDADMFGILRADGTSTPVTRGWLVQDLHRLGRHEDAERIHAVPHVNPIISSVKIGFFSVLQHGILPGAMLLRYLSRMFFPQGSYLLMLDLLLLCVATLILFIEIVAGSIDINFWIGLLSWLYSFWDVCTFYGRRS